MKRSLPTGNQIDS